MGKSNLKPSVQVAPIDWPPFPPPADPLTLDLIHPGLLTRLAALSPPTTPLTLDLTHPGLLTISNFFAPVLCKRWLKFLTSTSTPILLSPSPLPKRNEATRTNDRFRVDDLEFAKLLWEQTGLKEVCQKESGEEGKLRSTRKGWMPIGLNSNIRLYRYEPGAFIDRHYDDSITQGELRSEFTLLIYITGESDGVIGGGTAFYENGQKIVVPLDREKLFYIAMEGIACFMKGRLSRAE